VSELDDSFRALETARLRVKRARAELAAKRAKVARRIRDASLTTARAAHPWTKESLGNEVGQRIRYRRLEIGLTQEQLGLLIGVTRAQVNNLEFGRSGMLLNMFLAIAHALKARPESLLP